MDMPADPPPDPEVVPVPVPAAPPLLEAAGAADAGAVPIGDDAG